MFDIKLTQFFRSLIIALIVNHKLKYIRFHLDSKAEILYTMTVQCLVYTVKKIYLLYISQIRLN